MTAVLDTYFGGDEVPIAFGDWPAVRAARSEPDAVKMVEAFAEYLGSAATIGKAIFSPNEADLS